jgi:ABC-2 type transport system permease protein
VSWTDLGVAALLDVGYVAAALAFLAYALRYARRRGQLSRFGE